MHRQHEQIHRQIGLRLDHRRVIEAQEFRAPALRQNIDAREMVGIIGERRILRDEDRIADQCQQEQEEKESGASLQDLHGSIDPDRCYPDAGLWFWGTRSKRNFGPLATVSSQDGTG